MIDYKGLRLETSADVYDPEEDSYLLAENIECAPGDVVLDLGTGTGLQALAAAKTASSVLGVDINPKAVALAEKNASSNGITNAKFRLSDLFEEVPESFDLIIFNPPYVPASEFDPLGRAWSGGKDGFEVIEEFLKEAPHHLKDGGRVLFLFSSLNGLGRVKEACEEAGLSFELLAEKRLFFEVLYVARCYLIPAD